MASMDTLDALFEHELRDVYDAEKQVVKALPKLVKAAGNEKLRQALESHLEETRGQIERLEQVFEELDLKPRGKHCSGMAGILEEGKELMGEEGDDTVLDAGFIAAAQRVEHYEITAYGTLIAWADALGHAQAVSLLEANLEEEKAADKKLTELAVSGLNQIAANGGSEEQGSMSKARSKRR
jgi:ferritin-like metal-binding protein YciE